MILYNFVELLKNQFPSEVIYANGRVLLAGQESIPDRCILVIDNGGTKQAWTGYTVATFQIITRDKDTVLCHSLAVSLFDFIDDRYGLLLPDVTVNGTLYPERKVAQMAGVQLPYLLGADDEGRIEYSTNYQIIGED